MGILGSLGLDTIIKELGETARQVLPNKEAQRDFQIKLEEFQARAEDRIHAEAMGQLEVNKAEAGHASVFVAGWRPAIGWICASGLAWSVFIAPLLITFGLTPGMLPTEMLVTLTLTMLGASGIRTFELNKGIARDSMKGPRLSSPVGVAKGLEEAGLPQPLSSPLNQSPTEEENAPWNR